MKILVNCIGFIGDILFASSLAKKLKEKYPGCFVIYRIPLPQPRRLLQANPYIDRVVSYYDELEWPEIQMEIRIPVVDPTYPATIQMQAAAGIENQSLEFDVWLPPDKKELLKLWEPAFAGKTTIAYQVDWSWRAYRCTPQTLADGEGAPHRDCDRIVHLLSANEKYVLIPMGYDRNRPSSHPDAQNPDAFAWTAACISACDWFIGAEGGLSNLAAAVGTKCIITTDFIYQNYGPNGRLMKIENPQMGPAVYYPDAGHVHLDPCLTDDQIIEQIKEIIG